MRRLLLTVAVGLCAGPAFAQDRSDLQPAPPGGPGPGYYMPGTSPPTAPGGGGKGAGGEKGPSGLRGPVGRFIGPGGQAAPVEVRPEEAPPGEAAPMEGGADVYIVKKGDTLWSISAQFLRDPWAWPKLWALNPAITNPHWIYPGDIIRLQPEVAAEPIVATPPPTPPTGPAPKPAERPPEGVFLRQTAFIEAGELEYAGKIIGSKEEKMLLSTLDEAYVDFKKKKVPLELGKRYSIYKPIRTVKHPVTGKKLGEIVQIFGEADVRTVTDGKVARVLIVDSTDPIERGFMVGPLRRQFKVVPPRASRGDLSGVVVATIQPRDLIGTDMLVWLDRGEKDGVQVGNRFLVTRRGDGYQPILAKGPVDDPRFPRETVAEVLVVDLHDGLAAGIVLKAAKETRIGDRVELRAGY